MATTTKPSGNQEKIRLDVEYVRTIPSILKIVEIVLDILVLICASIDDWYYVGGGWVQFVAASALGTTVILFIFHFFQLISQLSGPWNLIEIIYCGIYVILFLIAAIVSAVRAHLEPSIVAACFFCFAALAVYTLDVVIMYRNQNIECCNTNKKSNPHSDDS
ncbi:MARVEL domain-containing protein 1-like [Pomacea canaliculata]|nr:MARVEL domain-containing protein 1-like [Pomacea canaliculata]XP_025076529.1 MARVEL domain-containing protein 1-like [Pomacea canaliculata]XP_025076530.1 MARVEL domain-containing protein 1-like [Pomacea canaliculata]XP_025076531.1 MARVEL domain-containing protein 1-like [Pomacea canaliculata]XP_025076533.1 MARVEL domain-containing protein 1-like [Pomacea canaliculata]